MEIVSSMQLLDKDCITSITHYAYSCFTTQCNFCDHRSNYLSYYISKVRVGLNFKTVKLLF